MDEIDLGFLDTEVKPVNVELEQQELQQRGYDDWAITLLIGLREKETVYAKFTSYADAQTARFQMYNLLRFVKRHTERFPAIAPTLRNVRTLVNKDGRMQLDRSMKISGIRPVAIILDDEGSKC